MTPVQATPNRVLKASTQSSSLLRKEGSSSEATVQNGNKGSVSFPDSVPFQDFRQALWSALLPDSAKTAFTGDETSAKDGTSPNTKGKVESRGAGGRLDGSKDDSSSLHASVDTGLLQLIPQQLQAIERTVYSTADQATVDPEQTGKALSKSVDTLESSIVLAKQLNLSTLAGYADPKIAGALKPQGQNAAQSVEAFSISLRQLTVIEPAIPSIHIGTDLGPGQDLKQVAPSSSLGSGHEIGTGKDLGAGDLLASGARNEPSTSSPAQNLSLLNSHHDGGQPELSAHTSSSQVLKAAIALGSPQGVAAVSAQLAEQPTTPNSTANSLPSNQAVADPRHSVGAADSSDQRNTNQGEGAQVAIDSVSLINADLVRRNEKSSTTNGATRQFDRASSEPGQLRPSAQLNPTHSDEKPVPKIESAAGPGANEKASEKENSPRAQQTRSSILTPQTKEPVAPPDHVHRLQTSGPAAQVTAVENRVAPRSSNDGLQLPSAQTQPSTISAKSTAENASLVESSQANLPIDKQPLQTSGPVKELMLRIQGPAGETVSVHLQNQGPQVHVSVRSSDPAVATTLRQDLSSLTNNLSRIGWKAETVSSSASNPVMSPDEKSQGNSDQHNGGRQTYVEWWNQQQHSKKSVTELWHELLERQS